MYLCNGSVALRCREQQDSPGTLLTQVHSLHKTMNELISEFMKNKKNV